jgi:glycosyltransferase involved in cell wall biosynthesis
MKIAIVAHGLSSAGGLSVARNIINSLAHVTPQHNYMFVLPEQVGYEELGLAETHYVVYVSRRGGVLKRILYDLFVLPPLIRRWTPDIVFCLGNFGLRNPRCFQAILYHKPHFVYPEVRFSQPLGARLKNWLIKRQIQYSLSKTDIVFCQTAAIRERFKKAFCYRGVIDILPNAVSQFVEYGGNGPSDRPNDSQFGFDSSKIKLLALTRYYPHKNLDIIVNLFQQYREELKGVSIILTIDKSQHAGAKKLLERVKSNKLENEIINVGPVDQALLPALYAKVDALFLPTLLESFSGTYVEAMQFQRPILTSDRDFAHAICGDAALYFDPTSIDDIKTKLLKFVQDETLRKTLCERGLERRNALCIEWDDIVKGALSTITSLHASTYVRSG